MALSTSVITSLKERIKNYLIEQDGLVDPPTQEMLEFAHKQLESSEEIANRVFGKRQKEEVVATVTEAAYYLLRAFFMRSESESCGGGIHDLKKAIHSLGEMVKELEEKFADQLYKPVVAEKEDDEVVSRDEHKSKMVGLSDQYNHLKERLDVQWATSLKVFSLIGMPGVGKTTLAREIFDDPQIVQHFDCRVWVTVGRKCPSSHVPRRILDQMCVEKGENTGRCLNRSLKGKRYLIVLDDAWDRYMVRYLVDFTYNCRGDLWTSCFPREQNGSRILLTSRLHQVSDESPIHMRLMDNEESWHLLREKVFAADSCSSQLERSGRKIAEKCEGLPLTIITVANLLSQQDKTVEYWNEVATRKHHQIYKAAFNEISEVLVSSYNHLTRPLQLWFMFIGVFPQDYEIPVSRLINLCYVDGFLEQYLKNHIAVPEYVMEPVFNSMVLVCKRAMYFGYIKTCRLHSSMRHLSNREATRNKFAHVLNIPDDAFGEDIKGQHRLSFHNNVLFSVKEVIKSVEDNCASAHSLFCYGPFLQYQVPICFGLRLLKLLDALSIRFYEFPMQVLQLVELRYLGLTFSGMLPNEISRLLNLQFLIVDRHPRIKSCKDSSYLPMEIWNMKELVHLQVMGNDFPNPCGASLENITTLSSVSPNSCSEDVFRAIPKINKLGIQIELKPDDDSAPLSCLAHVSHLSPLVSLKCVVVNPKVVVPPSTKIPTFASSLRNLTLSGLCCAWKEIGKIASLRHLVKLKLRNYAFQGPEWEVTKEGFPSLCCLLIEDSDILRWEIGHGSLLELKCVILKRCYKLKEINGEFGKNLGQIEMVHCNPLGAKRMKEVVSAEVRVSCSWPDDKSDLFMA